MSRIDIKERTLNFAVRIISLVRKFPKDQIGMIIGKQLVRSGTSIGANMEEADGASTRNDFFNKVSIARKEARETRYWLEIVMRVDMMNHKDNKIETDLLQKEASELIKILSSIINKK